MQKAHLYEAIFLVNQGIDQTVRGLARLKKAAGIGEEIYGDTLSALEHARAQANSQFLLDMQQIERRDAECYAPQQEELTRALAAAPHGQTSKVETIRPKSLSDHIVTAQNSETP